MNTTLAGQQDFSGIEPGAYSLPYTAHPLSSIPGINAHKRALPMLERLDAYGNQQVSTSVEETGSGIVYSDALEVFTMSANRYSCMKLVRELPEAALPETIETLTDLRDHYRSLENPSIRRSTPPLEYNVKPHVSPAE